MNLLIIMCLIVGVLLSSVEADMASEQQIVRDIAASYLEIDAGDVEVEMVENPFFRRWHFWRTDDGILPPMVTHVATLPGNPGSVLHVRENDTLAEPIRTEPFALTDPQQAVEFIEFYLQVTTSPEILVYKGEDIPGLSQEEEERIDAEISAPAVDTTDDEYVVHAYTWADGALKKARYRIHTIEGIEARYETIEEDIGVVITLE